LAPTFYDQQSQSLVGQTYMYTDVAVQWLMNCHPVIAAVSMPCYCHANVSSQITSRRAQLRAPLSPLQLAWTGFNLYQPSARMRSEGYCTWFVCLCVCLSVCLSVCLHLFSPYRDQASSSAIPTALAQQRFKKLCGDFA